MVANEPPAVRIIHFNRLERMVEMASEQSFWTDMVPLTEKGQSPRGSGGFPSDSVFLKKYKKIKKIFFYFYFILLKTARTDPPTDGRK